MSATPATTTTYEHVQIDAGGVPVITGTTMKVVELVMAQMAHGWSPEELHFQHPYLTLGQIHSALAYYWDHHEELDADIRRRWDYADARRSIAISDRAGTRLGITLSTTDESVREASRNPVTVTPLGERTRQPLAALDDLTAYARRFAGVFFERFPQWRNFAYAEYDHDPLGDLFVKVPAHQPHVTAELWVWAQDREVTVGIGPYYHAHFGDYEQRGDEHVFEESLQFIEDLVDERLVVTMRARPGTSWIVAAGGELAVPENVGAAPSRPTDPLICVLSWKGTFDRLIRV